MPLFHRILTSRNGRSRVIPIVKELQQRQFDRAIEASLAAQVDETGEPILPTIPFLRRTMVRVQRGAELERMMRLQET